MRQTRHKSTEVALGYLRPADLWRNNVTEGVFRKGETEPDGRLTWHTPRSRAAAYGDARVPAAELATLGGESLAGPQ